LRQDFAEILPLTTATRSAAPRHPLGLTLTFQPKRNNIVGNQIADLCAYPCARHILHPSRSNPPYEIVRNRPYQEGGVNGWKFFPSKAKQAAPEHSQEMPADRAFSVPSRLYT